MRNRLRPLSRPVRAVPAAVVEPLEPRQLFAAIPQVSIRATDRVASEVGGNHATYRVSRAGDLAQPLVVNFTVGGKATNGVDYGVIGNAITLAAGQDSLAFHVRAVLDAKNEPTESVTLTLASTGAYAIEPGLGAATVVIHDASSATLAEVGFFRASVNFQPYDVPVPAGYIVDGGASFKRQSNGRTYGWSASKTADTRDRNAANAYDQRYDTFISVTGTPSWSMAVPNGTYLVHLVAGDPTTFDATYNFNVEGLEVISENPNSGKRYVEGTETVVVRDGTMTISNGSGARNNKLMFANITQLADASGRELGVPLVTFSDARADGREPDDPGIWGVRRTGPTNQALTVQYRIGGTATNGQDYATLDGTVTIPAGRETAELLVDVRGDGVSEGSETVTATLLDGPGYVTGGDVDAVCTITEPNAAPSVRWTTSGAPQPQFGRVEAGVVQIGSKLYVLGGFDEGELGTTSRVDVLDFATGQWTQRASIPNGGARTHGGVATDGRFIYLVSGQPGDGYSAGTAASFKYDTVTNTWSSFAALPSIRFAGTLFYVAGKLHFVGGTSADRATPQDDHWVIDPSASSPAWTRAASMPLEQDHVAHAIVGDKVYVVGGEHGHASIDDPESATYVQHNKLFLYDPATGRWTTRANMPRAASHFEGAIQVINGKIVVFGGKAGDEDQTSAVQVYDPSNNTWRVISNAVPDPREGAATAIWQGRVWYGLGFSETLDITTRAYWGTLSNF